MGREIEIHYDPNGEWAALYVDGQLDRVGDAYLSEERAFELTGVKVVQDNAFLRGGGRREDVAQTTEQLDEYRWLRDNKAAEAARKREEAARLLAEADELDGKGGA